VRILGLVACTHDSGLAVLEDGVPTLVLEEERLNREKHTKDFPRLALEAAFGEGLAGIDKVDVITTPWDVVKLRRTFASAVFGRLPGSLSLVSERSHTPQNNEIVLLNTTLSRKIKRLRGHPLHAPIVNVGHHDSHAASFFVSPFEAAAVLVMDGYGDDAATSVYAGRGNRLERRWHTGMFNSLGMVYTFLTDYLGFGGFADEGKVMALAACGAPSYVDRFRDCIRLLPEGRYAVNMDYFSFDTFGQLKPFKRRFLAVFGPPRRKGDPLTDRHRDIACALQTVTEEVVLHVVRELARTQGSRNLVVSGGVALNCVANARILEETDFTRVWVPPCASDTGAPLGSALWHWHQTFGRPRGFELTHPFYGLAYDETRLRAALQKAGLAFTRMEEAELFARTARDLADGKVVGWFQGAFEMGPRALGNRSILADPRRIEIKDAINAKIKHREAFRPFAPAVLAERAAEFFHIDQPDPFMTLAPRVREDKKSVIPAAVHVDGTGRIQTVERAANSRYYGVIEAFGKLTGVPVLLNTSFNRQEPIVTTPEEAISCYLRTGMDVLVLGNCYTSDRGGTAVQRADSTLAPVA
jgi:carbamoyltransferase